MSPLLVLILGVSGLLLPPAPPPATPLADAFVVTLGAELTLVDATRYDLASAAAKVIEAGGGSEVVDDGRDLPFEELLPPKVPGLPATLSVGKKLTCVTPKGSVDLAITSRGYAIGAVDHLYLVLEGAKTLAGQSGLAFPAGTVAKGAVLTVPKSVPCPFDVEVFKKGLAAVTDKESLPAIKAVGVADLTCVAPKLPPGAAVLVSVHVPPKGDDLSGLAGMVLVDAKGGVVSALVPPSVTIEQYAIEAAIDLDGNGIDELHLAMSYYEGHSDTLLTWTGASYAGIIMADVGL